MAEGRITYMLRRGFYPWKFKESLRETLDYCRKVRIDEIMWMVTGGLSFISLAVQKRYLPLLGRLREATERIGVKYSINYLYSLGHGDYGYSVREVFPAFEPIIGHDGSRSRECSCPLSPAWRTWMTQSIRIMGQTHPIRFWVEDDFRYMNHGPVKFGCFCPRHLREFGRRIGERRLTRERLVGTILASGPPHPWRSEWLDFLNETLVQTAGVIRRAMEEVSPGTQVGLMTGIPWQHDIEGRDFGRVLNAFAGGHAPLVRLHHQAYQEGSLREFYRTDESLKRVMTDLPDRTCRCSEIESMPYHLYSKSAAWLKAEMGLCTIYGIPNHTLNIYDFMTGTPLAETPEFGDMLNASKSWLNGLWEGFSDAKDFRGIRILRHGRSARYVHTAAGKSPDELAAHESGWAHALRGFGFPITCRAGEVVCAVTGQALRSFATELDGIFSGGVLLDLSALRTLVEMGREDLAGAKVTGSFHRREKDLSYWAESLTDSRFAGGRQKYVYDFGNGDTGIIGVLTPAVGARAISEIVDASGRRICPGAIVYENKLGGRACAFPYDFAGSDPNLYVKGTTPYFFSTLRKRQMVSIVQWLARGKIPLCVNAPGWILPHRADGMGIVGLMAMNINHDPWKQAMMEAYVPHKVRRILVLNTSGRWRTLPSSSWAQRRSMLRIVHSTPVPSMGIIGVRVETAESPGREESRKRTVKGQ